MCLKHIQLTQPLAISLGNAYVTAIEFGRTIRQWCFAFAGRIFKKPPKKSRHTGWQSRWPQMTMD